MDHQLQQIASYDLDVRVYPPQWVKIAAYPSPTPADCITPTPCTGSGCPDSQSQFPQCGYTLTPFPTSIFPPHTATPQPSWPSQVSFDSVIPSFDVLYEQEALENGVTYCPLPGDPEANLIKYRTICSLKAIDAYRHQQLGDSITWGQLVSLLMYSEGNKILRGPLHGTNGTGSFCGRYRWSDEQWLSSATSGEIICTNGIQKHFPWAVTEYIHNYCNGAGRGTYEGYTGLCSSQNFRSLINLTQSLYGDLGDGILSFNPTEYIVLAQNEMSPWGTTRSYGQCPCAWENVGSEDDAKTYPDGNRSSYSYYYQPNEPDPDMHYFRVR